MGQSTPSEFAGPVTETKSGHEDFGSAKSGVWDPEDTGLDWMKEIRRAQARRLRMMGLIAMDFMLNTALLAAILWRVW